MSGPLESAGLWRAEEGALESGLPLLAAGSAWFLAWRVLGAPAVGRPWSTLELALSLGAVGAITGWSVARQTWLLDERRPLRALLWALGLSAGALSLLGTLVETRFAGICTGELGGSLVAAAVDAGPVSACQVGGAPGNPYLRGALLLPGWSGSWEAPLGLWSLGLAGLAALGLRDRRIFPTRIPAKLGELLRLAPGAGPASVSGRLGPDLRVIACDNPTLWGEPCGQLYAAEPPPEPGAWCLRCQQALSPCASELELTVISLFSADLDVLNGLERLDTLAWPQGEPPPADPRLSGQERWVVLGRIRLPDVLTMAQALALVQAQLGRWREAAPETAEASRLAERRMSRVGAWLLSGRVAHRLTYARPTRRARYGVGTQRLRDLAGSSGETLTLQLDTGLLPVELRLGARLGSLDPGRPGLAQNSRLDVWVPVGPPPEAQGAPGVWVARVEGEALRGWLATERVSADPAATTPIPYRRTGQVQATVESGELDLVRRPLPGDEAEPTEDGGPGASVAEWAWLEREQIELLRQQALVLVAREGGAR